MVGNRDNSEWESLWGLLAVCALSFSAFAFVLFAGVFGDTDIVRKTEDIRITDGRRPESGQ